MSISMPKGGVQELLKSASGREYLNKLRERHKKDLLQPSDPMFKKVYGNTVKKTEDMHAKQREQAQAEWERKNWKPKNYF